ncbi:hypothetical protein AX768_03620 [Burkholderia sp. PAMC 28687]|uniref:hypothetical protein n=1 Tax=Burkholderia sp. PAMC 28687 TaxID=1795874 RepID=UPI00078368BF|nr:hypothetical protein [Burkholderia sp. PAMC 28687]AMM13333.1 hypothetical protein AX768_03620 [Burkholderia sp. PAMC 28687]
MTLVSQAQFAKIRGVSAKTVSKYKDKKRLVTQGRLVDVEKSIELLDRYHDNRAAAVTPTITPPGNEGVTVAEKTDLRGNADGEKQPAIAFSDDRPPVEMLPGEKYDQAAARVLIERGANMSFDEARRVKENYLALLNELEYDQKSGQVVMVADVAKAVGEEYAKVRTRLLSIPSGNSPRLHRCKTVNELNDLLTEIITEALEELTADKI